MIYVIIDGDIRFGDAYFLPVEFCKKEGSYLMTYDANGDGFDDLLCKDADGSMAIMEGHIGMLNLTLLSEYSTRNAKVI